MKDYWKIHQSTFKFFCPSCRKERRLPFSPKPNSGHIFQILLVSLFLMLLTWPIWEWKGAVVFLPVWTVFEVFYRLRARVALKCQSCGFDPYLYIHDQTKAKRAIEEHWRGLLKEKGIPYPGDLQVTESPPTSNQDLTK